MCLNSSRDMEHCSSRDMEHCVLIVLEIWNNVVPENYGTLIIDCYPDAMVHLSEEL